MITDLEGFLLVAATCGWALVVIWLPVVLDR